MSSLIFVYFGNIKQIVNGFWKRRKINIIVSKETNEEAQKNI